MVTDGPPAGVDFEEAGEKWRAGDAAKSTRFFVRAIDEYEKGLRAFPQSFDLAYNKYVVQTVFYLTVTSPGPASCILTGSRARVQYQITQHARLLAQHATSAVELLKAALESHRYALTLRPDDADALLYV